jgi:hypothetical protein
VPPFKIEFDVPYGKYSRDLQIDSSWFWFKFVDEVARLMDCHASSVSLGYILPWKVKGNSKPAPKILDGDASFEKLKNDIQIWLSEQQAKNKGKGVPKHFTVQLVNLAADADPGKVRFSRMSYSLANPTVHCQANKKNAPPKSLADERIIAAAAHEAKLNSISREIHTRHRCNEHKVSDYVGVDGKHTPFTIAQITMWAELIVRTFPVLETGPNSWMHRPRIKKARASISRRQS